MPTGKFPFWRDKSFLLEHSSLLGYAPFMQLALFQPEIAGNVGTTLRTTACLGIPLHIIEPCGFPMSDAALKRAGMDYAVQATITRHADWAAFCAATGDHRLILLTSQTATRLDNFAFQPGDILVMGCESSGAPAHIHASVAARVAIPLRPGFRSLNVAVAAGIALGEALRQTKGYPE